MTQMLASVVIPLYNNEATICTCIEALLAQSIAARLKIIVVDDGSTDDGPARVKNYPVVLCHQKNAGPAAARNAGVRVAQGDIVLFLDADCVAPLLWAEQMLAAFYNPDILAAVGRIDSATCELLSQLIQTEIEERYRKLSTAHTIDFFASVAVAIRRQVFLDLGGFREDFRYSEDAELAYRINQQGSKMVLAKADRVLHHHPTHWRNYFQMKFCRGLWRMRTYQLFPQKIVSDSWTPQTLKFQIIATGLLPVLVILSLVHPDLVWAPVLLFCGSTLSGYALLRDAKRRGGISMALWGIPFLHVRAFALGSAMLWFLFTKRRRFPRTQESVQKSSNNPVVP